MNKEMIIMPAGVKPENRQVSPEAKKANKQAGYGPNNPEPMQFHVSNETLTKQDTANALHSTEEYIEGKN
jgi:hypothetical protein